MGRDINERLSVSSYDAVAVFSACELLAESGRLLRDPRYVLQPPGGTTAGPVPSVIERGSDSSQGVAALAHTADLIQHRLLGGIWLDESELEGTSSE